jgi:hypothetical protein
LRVRQRLLLRALKILECWYWLLLCLAQKHSKQNTTHKGRYWEAAFGLALAFAFAFAFASKKSF